MQIIVFFLILLLVLFLIIQSLLVVNNNIAKEKNRSIMMILDKWLFLQQSGQSFDKLIEKKGYYNIAIYGFGILGKHLLKEIQTSDNVTVSFVIENKKKITTDDILVISENDHFPKADCIIVTPINDYLFIKNRLSKKTDISVLSITEFFE